MEAPEQPVILVSGATGGLGPAVVKRFLNDGCTVVAVARSSMDFADDRLHPLTADLSTAGGVEGAFRQAVDAAGRIDAVVHVMGGFAGGKPLVEDEDATLESMWDVNVRPAFRIFRAALPAMLERGWGRLVAVGAAAALDPPPGLSAYAASKAAVNALVSAAAKETAGRGVTVNAVLPGTIDTPANREAMPNADSRQWVEPERLADDIAWLASDEAGHVTGGLFQITSESKPLAAR